MNSYIELGDPNELYKLHTGHKVFDDSGDSYSSLDEEEEEGSENSDIYRPPLYTLQELEANLVKYVPKPEHHSDQFTQEAVETSEQVVDELMKLWVDSNYCYICQADLPNVNNAQSHYGSMRHANNLHIWKKDALHKARRKLKEQVEKPAQPVIESPEQLVENLLVSLENTDFCYICEATLPNDHNAQSHYNSRRHRINSNAFKEYELSKAQILKKHSDMEKGANKEHAGKIHNEKQKRNVEDCNNDTKPNQSLEHYKIRKDIAEEIMTPSALVLEIPRVNIVPDMSNKNKLYLTEKARNQSPKCYICNLEFVSADLALAHHDRRHAPKADKSIPLVEPKEICSTQDALSIVHVASGYGNPTPTILDKSGTDNVCKPPLSVTQNTEYDNESIAHAEKNSEIICRLCQLKFTELQKLLDHQATFPHCLTVRLKADLTTKGIAAEYWMTPENICIVCLLCNSALINSLAVESHLASDFHLSRYRKWIVKQSVTPQGLNAKWFYCKTCQVTLDGTTNAENHYADVSHLRTQTIPATGVVQGSHLGTKTEEVPNLSVNSCGASSSTTDVIETRDSDELLHKKSSSGASSTYGTTAYVAKSSDLRSQSATAYVSPTRVREPDHTTRKPETTVPIRTQPSYAVTFAPRTDDDKETLLDEVIRAKLAYFEEKIYWSKQISSNSAVELLTRYINEIDSFEQRSVETMQQEIYYTTSGTPTYVQLHTNNDTVNRMNANPTGAVTDYDNFDNPIYEYYPRYDYFDGRYDSMIKKYNDYDEENKKRRSFLKSFFVYGSYGMILFFVLKRFRII